MKRRKARERQSLFVAEGVRAVEELLHAGLTVRGALASPALDRTPRGAALRDALGAHRIEVAAVSETDFQSAADTESPQGVLAIADVPARTLDSVTLAATSRLLVLDGIQDPGNVGTLVRTAAALGATAVIALPGTADLWNAKAVRSAVGAQFRIASLHESTPVVLSWLRANGVALWGADAHGEPVHAASPPARLAIAVGNEGAGLSADVRAAADRLVALPMAAGVESLNVAVAAGITLYALRP
ncbi:MAG: RNA methyltransferase [Gemmatimonadetes bacterium]|nr:RNA methyltransferase [Gemmatimonadota bacterium]